MKMRGGRRVAFDDPDGHRLEIFTRTGIWLDALNQNASL
jgi:hypothetical protein